MLDRMIQANLERKIHETLRLLKGSAYIDTEVQWVTMSKTATGVC